MFITVTHNTTSKERACRIICTGTSENGDMAGAESSPEGLQQEGLSFQNLPKLH